MMMDEDVKDLLRRYFDGDTTLEEERLLRERCAAGDAGCAGGLEACRPMFDWFAAERAVQPPVVRQGHRRRRVAVAAVLGMAAGVAVLAAVGRPWMMQGGYEYRVDGRRVYDREAAVTVAGSQLQLMAETLQKAQDGTAAFDRLHGSGAALEHFDRFAEVYDRALEAVRK